MALLLIAHRAGNDLKLLSEAFAAGVDYAAANVWLYRTRLEVRHDKTAGPIPLRWDRWSLRPGWERRIGLSQVVSAAGGRGRLQLYRTGQESELPAALTIVDIVVQPA